MLENFYRCLFDRNQQTCFGDTHKSVRVSPVRIHRNRPFFTINALHPQFDLYPTEPYHSANRPRRADHNVICFRNILLEMDTGSAEEQMNAITQSEIPWSTCVSSGGKSLHFIISLRDPLPDRLAYTDLVKRIYAALRRLKVGIDTANKNPSRFSRTPDTVRQETGRLQEIISVNGRVENESLESWLERYLPAAESNVRANANRILAFPEKTRLFASTEQFLRSGAPPGQWNNSLFRAACNLFDNGSSHDEVAARLQSVTGILDPSDMATIRSAYRRIRPSSRAAG